MWSLLHILFLQLSLKFVVNLCYQVNHGIRNSACSLLPFNYGNQDSSLQEEAQSMEIIQDPTYVSYGAILHSWNIGTGSESPSTHSLSIQNKSTSCFVHPFGLSL